MCRVNLNQVPVLATLAVAASVFNDLLQGNISADEARECAEVICLEHAVRLFELEEFGNPDDFTEAFAFEYRAEPLRIVSDIRTIRNHFNDL